MISVAELASLLTQGTARASGERPVVFDVRFDVARLAWGREEYERGHIPGARFADVHHDLASPATPSSGRHPLPDVTTFTAWLGAHGVSATTPVVTYDQGPSAFAARLWWLLRALGHHDVRVLDGGLAAWLAGGHAVTSDPPPAPTPATYLARDRQLTGWVTSDDVARGLAAQSIALVDARAADRFAGQNETIDPVAGHVPGARNRPFTANLGPDRTFLSPAQLHEQWSELLDGRAPSELVVMCGSGVTACHHLLALEHAGLPGARLYAGSWSEWIRDPHRPVQRTDTTSS